MNHRYLCAAATLLISASANAIPIELHFEAEIASVAPVTPPGVPSVGDTIVGSLVYESDTSPIDSPSITIRSFGRDAVLSGSFSISSASLGDYYNGSLVTDNSDPRVQNVILHNAVTGTTSPTDRFIVAAGLGGDTLGINRFDGDPLTYFPQNFDLTIFEETTAALADGFVEDARVLPTDISFGPGDGSFGFIDLDWQQNGGARWFLFATLTSVSTQPFVQPHPDPVSVPEPASLALLVLGLLACGFMRRIAGFGRDERAFGS